MCYRLCCLCWHSKSHVLLDSFYHLLQVFNDSNTFSEWFTRFLGVDTFGDGPGAPGGGASEAAALDREKKILVVNRLHQILSPFMLRRMVSMAVVMMQRFCKRVNRLHQIL
jgi:hypothetical protein